MTTLRRPFVPADVIAWRRSVLEHAGFGRGLASDLALDARIDLHDILNLVDRGCPPELAARILAPLDGGTTTSGSPHAAVRDRR